MDGTLQGRGGHPLLFGGRNIEGQQNGGRGVDCHGRADFIQGNLPEQNLHVRKGVNSYAHLPHLAVGHGIVRIVADLGREVKGDGDAGLSLLQQIPVTPVGLLRRGKAGVLAHGPKTSPVHGGLNPPGEGILPGIAELLRILAGDVFRRIQPLYRDTAGGQKFGTAFRTFFQRFCHNPGFPLFFSSMGGSPFAK